MKRLRISISLLVLLSLVAGCGEKQDRLVSAETDDGAWELTLEARKNSLRRGEALPVRVTLVRLAGQPAQTMRDTIEFIANGGNVSPQRLVFTFVGSQDTTYTGDGFTTQFADWITYSLNSSTSQLPSGRQGEISALFRDVEAVLKIRVIDDASTSR